MPLNRSRNTPRPARTRPAGPHCRGGASSVLRLTQPATNLAPSRMSLSDWLSRATDMVMPVTGPHFMAGAR